MLDNVMSSVFSEFLKTGKPEHKETKQKTTLLTLRIPEKLRDDFMDLCLRESRRTGNKVTMTSKIISHIYDCLEQNS